MEGAYTEGENLGIWLPQTKPCGSPIPNCWVVYYGHAMEIEKQHVDGGKPEM
jgi:hypothetical protein